MLRRLALVFVLAASTLAAQEKRSAASAWGKNYFPNVELVSHEGEHLRFFDDMIEGKVVAINFIYTKCPDSCPLETARLAQVQKILGDRVGKDVFMYSISIDPAHDTPEVLAEYVKRYDVGPGWKFLTGDEEDITLLRRRLGLYIQEIQDGSNNHNLSLVIGNQATGRWMKRSPFENPYVLATQLGGELHNWAVPFEAGGDYSEAPELRSIGKGESMFRTRCLSCHIVGEPDGVPRVGPDLFAVGERRDRDWLVRWIMAPDEMLAAEDPTAMGLFFAYNNVPMPNMRLTEHEVGKLLEYVDQETARVREARRIEALRADLAAEEGVEAAAGGDELLADAPGSCCQKDEVAVLSSVDGLPGSEEVGPAAEVGGVVEPAATASPESSGGGFSTSMAFFGGLGWLVGLVTGLLARRSMMTA